MGRIFLGLVFGLIRKNAFLNIAVNSLVFVSFLKV